MSNCRKCGERIYDPLSEHGDKLSEHGDKLSEHGDKLCTRCSNL